MTAIKWGDIVIGLDVHNVLVPSPGGPVPTPLPHPFAGVVFDPLGAAISAAISAAVGGGGLVLINGMPVGNTGTEVVGLGHMPTPPGTAFSPDDIPANQGTLVTGSKTVIFGGTSQSRTGSTVMSCSYPISQPTSSVISVPRGAPVIIGGPESVDAMAAVARTIRTKWVSKQLHVSTGAVKGSFRSKAICALTGHPVDVMSGELLSEAVDFELPGMIPVRWERNYRSRQTYAGVLGPGWCHPFEESIEETPDGVVLRLADGRPKEHPALEVGEADWDGEDRYTLTRTKAGYKKEATGGLRTMYERIAGTNLLLPIRIDDRCGNVIRLTYASGLLDKLEDTAGRVLEMRWTSEGRLAAVEVGGMELVRYEYSDEGLLAAAIDPRGHALRYEYRGGVMVKETRKSGLSFYFEWQWEHPEGWCVRTWGDGGLYERKITYDPHRHFASVEDGRGGITQYSGNALGLVEKVVDPMGVVTLSTWDEHCRKTSETDGLGAVTACEYDERGNCVLERNALGHERLFEYDNFDEPLRVTEPNGALWKIEYDGRGNVRTVRDPLGGFTRFEHDDHGRLVRMEDPVGRPTWLTWTARHDLESVTDGERRTTRFEHDALGRLVKSVDAGGRVTSAVRDALGRTTELTRADGERLVMTYDAEANVLEQVDALGRRVRMRYAGLGRLVEHTDPMGHTARLEHDVEEELVAVVNQAGEGYTLERDRAGRVVSEVGFDGRKYRYFYDRAGRPSKVLGPEHRVTEMQRDALGRLIRRTLSAPLAAVKREVEALVYNVQGELVEARTAESQVFFDRDIMGRVARERCVMDGAVHIIESRYNAAGERSERRSHLGHHVVYEHDTLGSLQALRAGWLERWEPAWELTIARDALGLESARRMPGAVVASWARDAAGRPTARRVRAGMTHPGAGRDVLQVGYEWRGPEQLGALIEGGGKTRFDLDRRGHLIGAAFPDGSVQHRTSDALGNVYRTEDRADRSYGPGGVVVRAGDVAYQHDGAGNLIEKRLPDGRAWKYLWDPAGRLRGVERPDGTKIGYLYDALGRRRRKSVGGIVTDYVWDGDELVHELVKSPDGEVTPVTWIFEPGSFEPILKVEGKGKERYGVVTDHLGVPLALVTEAGEIAWKAQLDIYGVPREEGAVLKTGCPWRYPGQYEDAETGLFYNRFRYYDPELGRYISQDPIGLLGGIALYGYADDPLTWIDPLGLNCGKRGERIARAYLEKRGFQVLGSVQNRSKHGIDLVARDASGKLWFFEVKATDGLVVPPLRGDQRLGAARFVPSRLWRAKSANGPWQSVHDPNTAAFADDLLTEINSSGGGYIVNAEVIQITIGNGGIKVRPW